MLDDDSIRQEKAHLVEEVGELRRQLTALKGNIGESPDAALPAPDPPDHETLYLSIFESTNVGICLTDLQGRITKCNSAYQKMLGYSGQELTTLNFRDLTLPEDLHDNVALVAQLLAGKRDRVDIQKRYVRKDGSICWVEMSLSLLANPAGVVDATLAVVHDVTARKQSELALAESEASLAEAQEIANSGSWVVNFNAGQQATTLWSAQMCRIFGVARDDVPQGFEAFLQFVHEEDRGIVRRHWSEASELDTPLEMENRIIRPDGEIRIVRTKSRPFKNEAGVAIRVTGSVTDVTESRQVERALAESEANLARAQAVALMGSWEWNLLTGTLTWSDQHYRLFGYDPGAGAPTVEMLLNRVHPDDQATVKKVLRQQEASCGRREPDPQIILCDYDHRIVLPGGEVRHVHERVEPALDDSGRLVGIRGIVQDITERKKAEEALSDSVSLLEHAQKMAKFGVWEIDYDKDIVTWTDEIHRMVGLERSEYDGRPGDYLRFVHPDDRERVARQAAELRGGRDLEYTYRLVRTDGQERIVHVRGAVTHVVDGAPQRARGFMQDITELKASESALRESEARFRSIFEDAAFGIAITGFDDQLRICNPAYSAMLGYELGELDGVSWLTHTHPDDIAKDQLQTDRLLRGEIKNFNMEKRYLRKNGAELWGHLNVSVVGDDIEIPRFQVAMIEDISERKAAEEALAESEASLADAQELANSGSWVLNFESGRQTTTHWSAQMCRIFGIEQDAVPQGLDDYLRYVHEDDHQLLARKRSEGFEHEKSYGMEYRIFRPSGEMRIIRTRSRPFLDEAHSISRLVGSVTDVTESKRSEEALADSEASLAEAQEIANSGSFVVNFDGKQQTTTIWSDQMCRIFGVAEDAVPQGFEDYLQYVHAEDRDSVTRNWSEAAEFDTPFEMENRIVRPNGEVRIIRTKSRPFKDETRAIRRLIGSVMDVTESRRAEDALRVSETRFRQLAEGSIAGVHIHRNFKSLIANQAYANIFGYDSPEEILALDNTTKLIAPHERERLGGY